MASLDICVVVVRLDKRCAPSGIATEKHVLYSRIVAAVLDRITVLRPTIVGEPIRVIASQRETNRILNANFTSFIRDHTGDRFGAGLEVVIARPSAHKGLQAVDCISWSFFAKYERGDASYSSILDGAVVVEETSIGA